jgi:hypothetical protein
MIKCRLEQMKTVSLRYTFRKSHVEKELGENLYNCTAGTRQSSRKNLLTTPNVAPFERALHRSTWYLLAFF